MGEVKKQQVLGTNEVNSVIRKLKNRELEVREIPDELALNKTVLKVERQLGLRKVCQRGFDVIKRKFFVQEFIEQYYNPEIISMFETFEEYYDFLDGNIYENACYYQYDFNDEFLKSLNLDLNIDFLSRKKCFIKDTIDDFKYKLEDEYAQGERVKKQRKEWMEKFNNCRSYGEFKKICDEFQKSDIKEYLDLRFFMMQYIYSAVKDEKKVNMMLDYARDYCSTTAYIKTIEAVAYIYYPNRVNSKYSLVDCSRKYQINYKRQIESFMQDLFDNNLKREVKGYFDKTAHFYCEETILFHYIDEEGRNRLEYSEGVVVQKIFETFDEFIKYRNGDLTDCDLSGALELNVDWSQFKMDDTTKLPIKSISDLKYKVDKFYDGDAFVVKQEWCDNTQSVVKSNVHDFKYFFDFIAFLKGDLSDANLVLCDGLENLHNIQNITFNNAKLTSKVCEVFGFPYTNYDYNKNLVNEFSMVQKNEIQTIKSLQMVRKKEYSGTRRIGECFMTSGDKEISYISDLHLTHRLKNASCKSIEDITRAMHEWVNNILCESGEIVLIGGDVSSDFTLFKLFVKMLRKTEKYSYKSRYCGKKFVFVLGNHELWGFPELSLEQIVEKYRNVLKMYGMYLLHNDLFYKNEADEVGIIPYNKLINEGNQVILDKLRLSRVVIFGGIGFSGYNDEFNANNGVYRNVINREAEIDESKKFENLYNKLRGVFEYKKPIILTHMPKKDWCGVKDYENEYIYVSGHTHKNVYYDDGVQRVYADNQIGYKSGLIHMKGFAVRQEFDSFASYEDGIYKISKKEYKEFIRGKNIRMNFNRNTEFVYMLKKKDYYCFLYKTIKGYFDMLDAGAISTKLEKQDVTYYYQNMDAVISFIEKPLEEYTNFQQKIADLIKKIGGSGKIHGCIIDIDFYNHIFVNPIDMTITGYYAEDMFNKEVYPDVVSLLEKNKPELYSKLEGEGDALIVLKKDEKAILSPELYMETQIYAASKKIKEMKKIQKGILTVWLDELPKKDTDFLN